MKRILEFLGITKDQDELKPQEFYAEDKHKLETGEEIQPPWVRYSPDISPWELRHDGWLINIWLVYWRRLSEDARETYRLKWNMPEDWYRVTTMFWTDIDRDKTTHEDNKEI